MPIKPENKARYPKNWSAISKRIRFERAANKCEVCGIENGLKGWRVADGTFYTAEQFNADHIPSDHEDELCRIIGSGKSETTIVLTVAHLDHTPENNDDGNLKAMCQRCHNQYDQPYRKANARQTRLNRKSIPLFA